MSAKGKTAIEAVGTSSLAGGEAWAGSAWLTGGSATVVVSFQLAILLGILWLLLAGRTARVERGEAEMLLVEEMGKPEGGER